MTSSRRWPPYCNERAAGRDSSHRSRPHVDGAVLRHAARRPRCRGHQGRACRRRHRPHDRTAPRGSVQRRTSPASTATRRAWCSTWRRRRGSRHSGNSSASARALVTNLRPSAIRKLGLTYDALKKWNPQTRLRRDHGLRARQSVRRAPRVRLRDPGRYRHHEPDRRSGGPADQDGLFGSRQLDGGHGGGRAAREAGGREGRTGRHRDVRHDAVAAQLHR